MQAYLKLKDVDEELYETDELIILNQEDNIFQKIKKILFQLFFYIVVKIKKWGNIITIKEIYSGFIFILPFSGKIDENSWKQYYFQHKIEHIVPKIQKMMKKYKITDLILEDNLRQNIEFMKLLCQDETIQKVSILNEKGMMPYLIKEMIEFILDKQGGKSELEDIYLLVQKENESYRENIRFLSSYFKTVNIITSCISQYQQFANKLEEKEDIILTVTNNKKKSLRKAKWIVNFDIPIEEMKKYTIYREATILYLEAQDVYQGNGFDGIHICQAGIDISKEIKEDLEKKHLLGKCDLTILYESFLNKKQNFWNIKEQLKKDQVSVINLCGRRGVLSDNEYKKKAS